MILIDPGSITFIQNTFLQHLNAAFDSAARYALNILYLFAALELAIVGLFWSLQQEMLWGRLFFKILKIGLIFFVIQNYSFLLNTIVRSFAQLGGIVASTDSMTQVIFNPATIWLYGYDVSIGLLRLAANSSSVGLSLLQVILGMGILFMMGLMGIQIVLQIVGFYLVSFAALIFMPFGVFNPSAAFFDQSIQSVLKAGVRVMVLILVVGIAVTVWHFFKLDDTQTVNNLLTSNTINQPLGLFFSALLFLYLAMRLPKMVSETVGHVVSRFGSETVPVVAHSTTTSWPALEVKSGPSSVQAAVSISPFSVESNAHWMNEFSSSSGGMPPVSMGAGVTSTGSLASPLNVGSSSLLSSEDTRLARASTVERSISETTLRKLKKTFLEVLEAREQQKALEEK